MELFITNMCREFFQNTPLAPTIILKGVKPIFQLIIILPIQGKSSIIPILRISSTMSRLGRHGPLNKNFECAESDTLFRLFLIMA